MPLMERLIAGRKSRIIGRVASEILLVYGLDIPAEVEIGARFRVQHRGMGTVIHPLTKIGNDVTIYHQVTIGRADAHRPFSESSMQRIVIEDGVTIFPGAKILGGAGVTVIGANCIIGANCVVTKSLEANHVWAGMPARSVRRRSPERPDRIASTFRSENSEKDSSEADSEPLHYR